MILERLTRLPPLLILIVISVIAFSLQGKHQETLAVVPDREIDKKRETTTIKGRIIGGDGQPAIRFPVSLYRRTSGTTRSETLHLTGIGDQMLSAGIDPGKAGRNLRNVYAYYGFYDFGEKMETYFELERSLSKQTLLFRTVTDEYGQFEFVVQQPVESCDLSMVRRDDRSGLPFIPKELVKLPVTIKQGEVNDVGTIVFEETFRAPEPDTDGQIVGEVYDDRGEPIRRGLRVKVIGHPLPPGDSPAISCHGHAFSVHAPPGRYALTISAEGFAPQIMRNIDVQDNEVKKIEIRLAKGIEIRGVVRNPRGQIVENAIVLLTYPGGEQETETDGDGSFVLDGISRDLAYNIRIWRRGVGDYDRILSPEAFPGSSTIYLEATLEPRDPE